MGQKGKSVSMAGQLYLCATPIGNLDDITLRVLDTLKNVDLIAAEDTRHTIKLLNHFDIKTKMTSYHEFNKVDKAVYLVKQMQDGLDIALVTDAGTPGISDPGEELVRQCHEADIKVTSLPGACACVTALTISGLPTRRFCFEAFLPTDKKERKAVFNQLKTETRTIILYEAPHRLKKTLKEILSELGNRNITLCRELTKRHEDYKKMTLEELIQYYDGEEVRGECVLVIEGISFKQLEQEEQEAWENISIEEHMEHYLSEGFSKKDAMKKVAKDRGVGKREIYQALIK
jgi:16S rRNA (cytidine1402-2'-O)-methyltransferase